MVPAELMCENTNPDKLVPSTCTTWPECLREGNVV